MRQIRGRGGPVTNYTHAYDKFTLYFMFYSLKRLTAFWLILACSAMGSRLGESIFHAHVEIWSRRIPAFTAGLKKTWIRLKMHHICIKKSVVNRLSTRGINS